MAAQDLGFANDDLEELRSHLLELKLALSIAPTRRPQRKSKNNPKTTSTSLSDTKDAIIEKAEHSNFRLPASKASRDLYNKLKEVRDHDCTEDDTNQVHSLLKSFIRQLDPEHPFLAEPEEFSPEGDTTDVQDANRHRERRMRFTNYNVNEMLESLGITDDDDGNLGEEDHDDQDPDYQGETARDSETPMETTD
ncbi:hypothetical protein F53441_4394 [Fusarium austroafricanum]|uniref:Uncharacterized protein n=1 Tax=Fusarium austroafricanum TaxID=2364996 RepID=A0A8H4KNH3_9HYPO|nr:hypothetical protein F53441_4394 [Fusarium austroafricanum]